MASDYETFKQKYLVKNFKDKWGKPKHTRLVKDYFYRYNEELKNEFGFDLHCCDECGRSDEYNGKPVIMELEHINRITNDSRIENLRSLCPMCHTQTPGYKNRMVTIEEHWSKMWGVKWSEHNV